MSNPVPNNGAGVQHEGNRIAQENIRQRLQIAFGGRAELLTSLEDGIYSVTLRFPEMIVK
jgi:LytS/YehU family sensor histidine kinase